MRKLVKVMVLFVVLSLSGAGYPAETKIPQKESAVPGGPTTDVSLRFSRHEGFSRIVFEAADEQFIRNTTATAEKNQIRVKFPSGVSLKAQGNVDLDTSLKGNLYTITLNSPFNMKVLKLSSPFRVSIDFTMAPSKEESPWKSPVKAPSPDITGNLRVVIDPGHGGYDLGIISGDLREKDITFSVARSMEAALIKKNRAVYLTRKADQFLSITDRAIIANQKSPDVFISIHLSQTDTFVIYTSSVSPMSADSGAEYGLSSRQKRYTEKSSVLAETLGKVLKDDFKKDIIFRKMDMPLLASVGAAAVMVELPAAVASDQGMKAKIPESLLKGLSSYANK